MKQNHSLLMQIKENPEVGALGYEEEKNLQSDSI